MKMFLFTNLYFILVLFQERKKIDRKKAEFKIFRKKVDSNFYLQASKKAKQDMSFSV